MWTDGRLRRSDLVLGGIGLALLIAPIGEFLSSIPSTVTGVLAGLIAGVALADGLVFNPPTERHDSAGSRDTSR